MIDGYRNTVIPELLEECVIPTMKKLGLEDEIFKLKEKLTSSIEQTNPLNQRNLKLTKQLLSSGTRDDAK